MYPYAYLVGNLILLAIYGLLYFLRPSGRRAMGWTGVTMAPAGPLSEYWHVRDYWNPVHALTWRVGDWTFGIEDFLFGFVFSGISAGVFVWLTDLGADQGPSGVTGRISPLRMIVWLALLLGLLGLGTDGAGMNSLHASIAAFVVLSAWFLFRRPSSLGPALATGAIAAAAMWVFYAAIFVPLFPDVFQAWWRTEALSGLQLLGVPVEEPAWAFFAGAFCGLLHPQLLSTRNKKRARDD